MFSVYLRRVSWLPPSKPLVSLGVKVMTGEGASRDLTSLPDRDLVPERGISMKDGAADRREEKDSTLALLLFCSCSLEFRVDTLDFGMMVLRPEGRGNAGG
jgi:hypothetical protein